MGRAPCCDKANVKKGPWSPEEDAKLKDYIDKHGTGGNWISLPQKAGLKRCGKSCRLRWLNYLRPNIKHGEFSDDEDRVICTLYATIGSRWSIIAAQLPGRTDNDIKNYWNTKLKKKLMSMGFSANTNINTRRSTITNLQYPMAMLHSSSSSSSSSSSLSSSSPYHCTPAAYYNSPTTTMSFTMQGYLQPHPQPQLVKDNNTLLIVNQAVACSSSDESNEDQQQGIYNTTIMPSGNGGNNGGLWGQTQSDPLLDYGLEEIKQLISTNINCFEENKAEETTKLMYYYY